MSPRQSAIPLGFCRTNLLAFNLSSHQTNSQQFVPEVGLGFQQMLQRSWVMSIVMSIIFGGIDSRPAAVLGLDLDR